MSMTPRSHEGRDGLRSASEIREEIVRRDIEREWRQLVRKYGHLAEFWPMVQSDVRSQ